MKKLFLLLFFLTLPENAEAVCTPSTFYDAFSTPFPTATTITGLIFGLDESYLYVTLPNNGLTGFINTPQSVVQRFSASSSPDTFFAQQILNQYGRPLFTSSCQNILTSNGKYLIL